jgi:hypothetical protein
MEDKSLRELVEKSTHSKAPDVPPGVGNDQASTQPVAPKDAVSEREMPRPKR